MKTEPPKINLALLCKLLVVSTLLTPPNMGTPGFHESTSAYQSNPRKSEGTSAANAEYVVYLPLVSRHRPPSLTLREAADAIGIKFGGHGIPWYVANEPQFKLLLEGEYNLYMTDCEICWRNIRPNRDGFDFSQMDQVVLQAKSAGMSVQAHHLVWGYRELLPTWLLQESITRQELLDILKVHVQTVVGRYKAGSTTGEVAEWTVINEIFGNGPDGSTNFFAEKLEPDPARPTYAWAEDLFIWAHEADPNAKLILNDFHIENRNYVDFAGPHQDRAYGLVNAWIAKGIPIHGIGFQMHLNAWEGNSADSLAGLAASIQRFQALGIEVYVTEFDLTLRYEQRPDRLEYQALSYQNLIRTLLDNGVTSISFMGLTDRYSWREAESALADPTLFDENYDRKAAYYSVLAELNRR